MLRRRQSLKEAGKRYQQTPAGQRKHAQRQSEYRDRQKEKVTHQGPQRAPDQGQGGVPALQAQQELKTAQKEDAHETESTAQPPCPQGPPEHTGVLCSFCRQPCSPFVRRRTLGQLRASGYQVQRRPDSS